MPACTSLPASLSLITSITGGFAFGHMQKRALKGLKGSSQKYKGSSLFSEERKYVNLIILLLDTMFLGL